MLDERPARAHQVVGRVEARGAPGTNVRFVYDELRRKAEALGADAVVRVEQRKHTDAAPLPSGPQEWPQLGEAYPGPLDKLEPGALPSYGFDVQTRGPYYVVEGLAIRYH